MTNIGHHSILVLRKFDSIDYCDFHYYNNINNILANYNINTLPNSSIQCHQPLKDSGQWSVYIVVHKPG